MTFWYAQAFRSPSSLHASPSGDSGGNGKRAAHPKRSCEGRRNRVFCQKRWWTCLDRLCDLDEIACNARICAGNMYLRGRPADMVALRIIDPETADRLQNFRIFDEFGDGLDLQFFGQRHDTLDESQINV